MLALNSRQRKTLERIYAEPTRSDVTWPEVRALLEACGASVKEGRGSRVRIGLGAFMLNMHTPHPQKEMKKYMVELAREFLAKIGVGPERE
ncbi:MAG: hypothetical protein B193_2862 [Solidesulfovibrio magneticus str. Maddingley MBC34]|uniref:HicA protein n=1 Tax=Solidesulfovibrio magneticus str. Maddingley MBC34 TaxID=1206767 RepID=K6GNA0_9BACT|nr:MAG: hypothetical protein B193_2862 [Solidesulfovibrio magneticus str. Maddingley MBC34]